MLHAFITRFDVMSNVALFRKTFGELSEGSIPSDEDQHTCMTWSCVPADRYYSIGKNAEYNSKLDSTCMVACRLQWRSAKI